MDEKMMKQGMFSWNELKTADVEAAKKFYGELLGWSMEEMPMEGMTYTVVKAGDEEIGGIMAPPPQAQRTPPHWGAYVTVDDVDATAGRVEELGGKILVPPSDIPGVGRVCALTDPQGAALSIITYVRRPG